MRRLPITAAASAAAGAGHSPFTRRQWLPSEGPGARGTAGPSARPPRLEGGQGQVRWRPALGGKAGAVGWPRSPAGWRTAPAEKAAWPRTPADGAASPGRRTPWSLARPAGPIRARVLPRTSPCATCAGTCARTPTRASTPRAPATRPAPRPRQSNGKQATPPLRCWPSSLGPRIGILSGRPEEARAATPTSRSGASRSAQGRRGGLRPKRHAAWRDRWTGLLGQPRARACGSTKPPDPPS
mmetsp:Transcript_19233/g.57534  ORF Transcript_19233/g.57534 Transcript_19233/m.57534 type:complete len:241 (-) Transcript_19233:819-1541(-)